MPIPTTRDMRAIQPAILIHAVGFGLRSDGICVLSGRGDHGIAPSTDYFFLFSVCVDGQIIRCLADNPGDFFLPHNLALPNNLPERLNLLSTNRPRPLCKGYWIR